MVDENSYLGEGSFWIVERIKGKIKVNGKDYSQYIVKWKKQDSSNIEENITAYNKILEAGLPTLSFFEKRVKDDKECIVAEDLNSNENIIYVSPNTTTHESALNFLLINKQRESLAQFNTNSFPMETKSENINSILSILQDELKEKTKGSFYETKLSGEKIDEICNFDDFMALLLKDMEIVSKANIGMCADAFFFGISNDNFLTYKVADFDCIILDCKNTKSTINGNKIEALQAFGEFIENFVKDNELKVNYQREINKMINEYSS